MTRWRLLFVAVVLVCAATVYGSPGGSSIAINFAANEFPDEPDSGFVEGAAGVVGTVNWNNTLFQDGLEEDLMVDVNGGAVASSASVEWFSTVETWATDGRGEDNNDAFEGNDRNLMLGYLDTNDTSITEVQVDGLPAEIAGGFDVFVYTLGGVLGRGGTYTISAGQTDDSQENVNTVKFDGTYLEGAEGNYVRFQGLSGDSFTLEAQATTTALFRGPLNAIEVCAAGACIPPNPPVSRVAGRERIGDQELSGTLEDGVLGPPTISSGLLQEWYAVTNPGSKAAIDDAFDSNTPMVPPFTAGHGATWWTGNQAAFGDLVKYPDEVSPPLPAGANNNDDYSVRATGDILIPESGPYRFTDGADDFTWLAIDTDKSGVAGDSADEVLIDDNAWTGTLRADNNGGGGYAEVDIDVAAGGEWLAIEVNTGEGGGSDAGIIYWDYNPDAPEGDRLGGGEGFPEFVEEPIFDTIDAEGLYIPDTHLHSETREVLSAALVATLDGTRQHEFEVDGDTDTADKYFMENPDPNTFSTVANLEDALFRVAGTGNLQDGDTFKILDAEQINGSPTIEALVDGQTWSFNSATGELTFGGGVTALQAGDANQDLQFDQLDLVQVQVAAKYLTGQAATWGEGDWDAAPGGSQGNPPAGDGFFNQADIVAALTGGKYLQGSYGVLAGPEGSGDGNATIVYDATTGELGVEVPGTELTAVNITSAAGIFTGDPADNLSEGGFDNDTDENIFKSTFGSSFGSLSFGNVAQTGLSEEFVTGDLTVIGALAGGGGLGAVDLRYIPEPSSAALLALGLVGGLLVRRRRRS